MNTIFSLLKQEEKIVLPDVSLCAIVRDEIINPAGGIERFVESHVPYVEEAVIADTGSVDGTREKLEELQAKYRNLKIVDFPFINYADARNKSLSFVKTKKALVLDADELITHKTPNNDWKRLFDFMNQYNKEAYIFDFLGISPDRENFLDFDAHFIRLFTLSKKRRFVNDVGEHMRNLAGFHTNEILIKHFVPSMSALELKKQNWYVLYNIPGLDRLNQWSKGPSKVEGFAEWKAYNPKRDNYI